MPAHQLCAAPAAAAEEVENAGTNSPPPVHTSVKRCHEDARAVGADEARQACGGARRCLMQIAVARPVDARHRRVVEFSTRLELLHRLTA